MWCMGEGWELRKGFKVLQEIDYWILNKCCNFWLGFSSLKKWDTDHWETEFVEIRIYMGHRNGGWRCRLNVMQVRMVGVEKGSWEITIKHAG